MSFHLLIGHDLWFWHNRIKTRDNTRLQYGIFQFLWLSNWYPPLISQIRICIQNYAVDSPYKEMKTGFIMMPRLPSSWLNLRAEAPL